MSVYKYDENTQTMREYDVAYQVQSGESLPKPNTIERLSDNSGKYLTLDNTWLPYLAIGTGEYLFNNNNKLGSFNALKLIPGDVPVGCYFEPGVQFPQDVNSSQMLIDNRNARWGATHLTGTNVNLLNLAIIDEEFTGSTQWAHSGDIKTRLLWIPNGTIGNVCHWTPVNNTGIAIFNALDMGGIAGEAGARVYKTIYLNEELHQKMIESGSSEWDSYYEPRTIDYTAAETEWLEDYFIIEQDGQSIEWYEDTISNEYGKFIRLKKNNTKVAELMYWKDGKIEEEIGLNLTDTAITRTGSITLGDVTKTYSITQKPMARTLKARMYFNPVEQDGKNFNNFCVWPLSANFGVNDGNWNQTLRYFIKIRYKAAGDTTWTTITSPTASELRQKSTQIAGHDGVQIIDLYTVEINTAGYYDVEWTFYADELYSLMSQWDEYQNRWIFSDRKMWYDYTNQTYEVKENEDMYLENTPFVVSIDYGKQYVTDGIGKHGYVDNFNIRDWDDNPRMETLSIGPCNAQPDRNLFGGMMGRGLKYLVYNNIQRGNGHYDWVGCENWDNVFSNEGILFYVIPERQKFDNWFLGCSANPHIVYLHPDIYALSEHGFNGEVNGWDQSKYQEAGSPELRELPSNWKTLVPNYIGE